MTRQLATATARRALEMCLVGVLAAASTATQADAQTSVIITACYPKPAKNGAPGSGVVYRINKPVGSAPGAPASCSTGDLEFSWAQVGPAGPTGPAGPEGATGSAGPEGPSGPQGTAGVVGPQGATGPAGPQGAQGTTGSQGPSGVSGYAFQQEIYVSTPPGLSSKGMYCPDGKLVLSGGYRVEGNDPRVHMVWSTPIDGGPGWFWRILNETGGNTPISFYTLCASMAP